MSDTQTNDFTPAVWQLDVELVVEETTEAAIPVAEEPPPVVSTSPAPPPPLERIIEALLFVASEPIMSEQFCHIIRGLDTQQLQECVRQLNQSYRRQARPYVIEQHGQGHRLVMRPRYRGVVEQVYGGVREARFSAAAVETLAVVAYRQPTTRADIDSVRGHESEGPLRQLVRRGLVAVQGKDGNGLPVYATTQRFLEFFRLRKLDELPRADDLPVS